MKIMIAGDSFGLPRPFMMNNGVELRCEDTYPEQLRKKLYEHFHPEDIIVTNNCKRANSTLGILNDLKNPRFGEIYLNQPEFLVIQVGNVDCFERGKHHDEFAPFSEFQGKNPWVGENEFVHNMGDIIKESIMAIPDLKSIIIVNIPPIKKEDNAKNLATRQRISTYNRNLRIFHNRYNLITVADIYKLFYLAVENPFSSDGIHPNRYGSKLIAGAIYDEILQVINREEELLEAVSRENLTLHCA